MQAASNRAATPILPWGAPNRRCHPPIPVVQRLAVSEKTVNAQNLKSIQELPGGHKGVVFLIENQKGERLVVKFQNEHPKEAIIGTGIVKSASAQTPDLRLATPGDLEAILGGLEELGDAVLEQRIGFRNALAKYKYSLVMGFAPGKTIKKVMNETPLRLIQAMQSRQFQEELGKILAADAFAGNPDRAFAGNINSRFEGWYHEQNFFITEDDGDFSAVAIDNTFQPYLPDAISPYGLYVGGAGVQYGSVAAANPRLFRDEAGLIFDRIVIEIIKRHKADVAVQNDVAKLKEQRDDFASGVVDGAQAAMKRLLKSDQHWKKAFAQADATEEELTEFRERKRYLRLLAADVDPQEGRKIARNTEGYKEWKRGGSVEKVATKQKVEVSGKKNGCCFLTTACVEARGLPDDCEELSVLRDFRDSYLLSTENGTALVEHYYEIAPKIVEAIDQRGDSRSIYEGIYERIVDCLDAVKSGRSDDAIEIYERMVLALQDRYGRAGGTSSGMRQLGESWNVNPA